MRFQTRPRSFSGLQRELRRCTIARRGHIPPIRGSQGGSAAFAQRPFSSIAAATYKALLHDCTCKARIWGNRSRHDGMQEKVRRQNFKDLQARRFKARLWLTFAAPDAETLSPAFHTSILFRACLVVGSHGYSGGICSLAGLVIISETNSVSF